MTETTTSFTPVPILYENHRGEVAVRRIVPGPLWFGSTEWHPEPQWLMTADEPDTGKRRDFAVAGIKAWGDAAVDVALEATTAPTDREALRKAVTEITDAADKMILSLPGHWHDDATIELTDAAADARAALSAARQNDLYVIAPTTGLPTSGPDDEARELAASERISAAQVAYDEWMADCDPADPEYEVCAFEAMKAAIAAADARASTALIVAAARDLIAENADCRRPAVACGAGGTGTGGCGCLLTADAVLRVAAPIAGGAR